MDKWLEKKIKPKLWKIKYKEILSVKPKRMKGRIKATQYAIKRNKDRYDLIMRGKRI